MKEQKVIYKIDQLIEKMKENGQVNSKLNLKKNWWTQQQDNKLKTLVFQYGAKNWKNISVHFENQSDVQCLHRWQKVLNPKHIKGPWTKEEDQTLIRIVQQQKPEKLEYNRQAITSQTQILKNKNRHHKKIKPLFKLIKFQEINGHQQLDVFQVEQTMQQKIIGILQQKESQDIQKRQNLQMNNKISQLQKNLATKNKIYQTQFQQRSQKIKITRIKFNNTSNWIKELSKYDTNRYIQEIIHALYEIVEKQLLTIKKIKFE